MIGKIEGLWNKYFSHNRLWFSQFNIFLACYKARFLLYTRKRFWNSKHFSFRQKITQSFVVSAPTLHSKKKMFLPVFTKCHIRNQRFSFHFKKHFLNCKFLFSKSGFSFFQFSQFSFSTSHIMWKKNWFSYFSFKKKKNWFLFRFFRLGKCCWLSVKNVDILKHILEKIGSAFRTNTIIYIRAMIEKIKELGQI